MSGRFGFYLVVALCAALGAVIYLELAPSDVGDAPAIEIPVRPAAASALPQQHREGAEQLMATILARPLFSPTRRPSDKSEGAKSAELSDTRLTGIVTEPERRIAIFAVNGGKPLSLGEGESVSGWRIDSITPREVSLSGPSGTTTLEPKTDPTLVRAVAKPPPPPPNGPAPAPPPNTANVQMRPVLPAGAVQPQVRPSLPAGGVAPPFRPQPQAMPARPNGPLIAPSPLNRLPGR